jgi:hypothetical protein
MLRGGEDIEMMMRFVKYLTKFIILSYFVGEINKRPIQ